MKDFIKILKLLILLEIIQYIKKEKNRGSCNFLYFLLILYERPHKNFFLLIEYNNSENMSNLTD